MGKYEVTWDLYDVFRAETLRPVAEALHHMGKARADVRHIQMAELLVVGDDHAVRRLAEQEQGVYFITPWLTDKNI